MKEPESHSGSLPSILALTPVMFSDSTDVRTPFSAAAVITYPVSGSTGTFVVGDAAWGIAGGASLR